MGKQKLGQTEQVLTVTQLTILLRGWWTFLWLALVSFLVYIQTMRFKFMPLDDELLIQKRIPFLSDPSNMLKVFQEPVFFGKTSTFFRPLLTLSFMVDTIIGKGQPWMYHLSNILLHIASVLLLFILLRRLLGAYSTKAFLITLLFAVHPVFTAAVAFIPGRNDTLLAVFTLAGFICFLDHIKARKLLVALLHLLFMLCALLTKESAVVILPLLLLWLWLFEPGRFRDNWRLGAGWVSVVLIYLALHSLGQVKNESMDLGPKALYEFLPAMLVFLGKVLLPIKQVILPITRDSSLLPGMITVLLLALAVLFLKFHNRRMVIFGWGWFLAFLAIPTLAASSSLLLPIHHEHRLYVPAMGLVMALSQIELLPFAKKYRRAGIVLFLTLMAVFSARTMVRSRAYATPVSFAEHAVLESPHSSVAYQIRGSVFLSQEKYKEAIPDFERSLDLRPNSAMVLTNIGKAYYQTGRVNEALQAYTQAIGLEPEDIEFRNNRGYVYLMDEKYNKAIEDYSFVIERDPLNFVALNNRGKAFLSTKHYDKAVDDFNQAITADPKDGEAYHNRAVVHFMKKNFAGAWRDVHTAQGLGIPVVPAFLTALQKASGWCSGKP